MQDNIIVSHKTFYYLRKKKHTKKRRMWNQVGYAKKVYMEDGFGKKKIFGRSNVEDGFGKK